MARTFTTGRPQARTEPVSRLANVRSTRSHVSHKALRALGETRVHTPLR